MSHRANVDATPCFLPIFLLFGLGGNRSAGARPYNRGIGDPRGPGRFGNPGGFGGPGGTGMGGPGNGAAPWNQGYGMPGTGYQNAPGNGNPGGPTYYSPWAIQNPQGRAAPGANPRRPMMF